MVKTDGIYDTHCNSKRLESCFGLRHVSGNNYDTTVCLLVLYGDSVILILNVFDYDSGTGSCISWLMALNGNDKVPVWSSPDTIAASFPFSI